MLASFIEPLVSPSTVIDSSSEKKIAAPDLSRRVPRTAALSFALVLLAGFSLRGFAETNPGALPPDALPDAPGYTVSADPGSAPVMLLAQTSSSSSTPEPQQPSAPGQPPAGEPSLSDLGLSPEQTHGDVQRQALLDRRTHMLKVHQRLGLLTVIPVAAACITSIGATPDRGNYGNTTSRDIHVAFGATAVAMYGATAWYAIRAPKASNEPARGGIKIHKYLIYIHAPGMVLTPILGAMAFNQINSGQKVHGIASAHGAVAAATAISYGAAIVAVSWPIHF